LANNGGNNFEEIMNEGKKRKERVKEEREIRRQRFNQGKN